MQNLILVAALGLSGLFISGAVPSAENAAATNPLAHVANTTKHHTAHVTSTTTARHTTHATNTTKHRTTPAHVTNMTTANHTTPAHVTNMTTANHTTPAHVTNMTTANHTTPAHVTNMTTANHTTPAHVTNMTTANHTTPAHVTNTTTANHTTPAHVTNTTTANYTTPVHVTNTTTANYTTTMHPTVLPTLSPNSSLPLTGNYNVTSKNATCIKLASGIQLIVIAKPKNMYFNILPEETVTSGNCGSVVPWINLNFHAGFLNFTFGQDGNHYFISEISTVLHSMNNLGNTYNGIVMNMKLFHTKLGHSYKCKSKQVVAFSTNTLQVLMINTQLQAFNIPGGTFGRAEECFLDYKYVLPVAFGVVLGLLIIIIIIVYLIYRRHQAAGYQRI